MIRRRSVGAPVALAGVLVLVLWATSVDAARSEENTIKSLENKQVEIRPGRVIVGSSGLARDNYRAFLDLVSDDPELRAEAMRRLGDLELEATETEQLVRNIDALDHTGYNNAVSLYQQLLEAYPDYQRNDTVLYQLARAYEIGGQTDAALDALDELVAKHPDTLLIDEVQFRRGEMLFLRKRYNDSEVAYRGVVDYGEASRFYEQSLYKLGWSQFKLAWHEESFVPFFNLLDRKIGDIEIEQGDKYLQSLKRTERELVDDTFRVLSISFSYMDGAASIDEFLAKRGNTPYSYAIYRNLGDLYLEKERYQDAALAYEAFVKHDPYHPKSPLLQVELINAYTRGGFPSLVLEGKRGFVERYAMDGEFWLRNPRKNNTEVAAHLKANLMDLARYYHAEAQENREQSDYQEAANWYRKYLAYFPGESDSANTNFLLAETLYESRDFELATTEYERTAYEYAKHEKSAEAGYAAILAYRAYEEELDGAAQQQWHAAYLDSGLKFADTYPEHPESGAVLTTVAEDLFRQDQFDLAIAVGEAVVAKQPSVDARLLRTAWTVIAHSQFDLLNFSAAESSYYELRNFTPIDDVEAAQQIKDRIASSIYKQGERARDDDDLETAVTHFTRLGSAVPDAAIRATAEYDAAAALINLKAWERASGVLEQFRTDYPDSEFADDVTQKLAVSYLETGNSGKAAAEFERIADDDTSAEELRREALWKASDLYKKTGPLLSEQRVLNNILKRYPTPLAESIEARFRLLEIARLRGDHGEVTARLEQFVVIDATAGEQRSNRTQFLAAKASLELAEPLRHRFMAVRLTQPLAGSLKLKKERMQELISAYTGATEYGVAEVTTAATFRLGEVYEIFSADLMSSERPAELDADALEQYEILLEEQVFPFEEKAIDLYKANADRASDGVYDSWVQRSFEQLARLLPGRYAKQERSEDVVTAPY